MVLEGFFGCEREDSGEDFGGGSAAVDRRGAGEPSGTCGVGEWSECAVCVCGHRAMVVREIDIG